MARGFLGILSKEDVEARLVAEIREEIQERQEQATEMEGPPLTLLNDHLVCLVGELALSISQEALGAYELTLWPHVREVLGMPGDLLSGDYRWAISETQRLLQEEEPDVLQGFMLAAADSSSTDLHNAQISALFLMRLEAGFFLAGLQTLWPPYAPILARRVWHDCALEEWDQALYEFKHSRALATLSKTLRQMLTDSSARLDRDRFDILLDLAAPKDSLHLVGALESVTEDSFDVATSGTWPIQLLHSFFMQFYGEQLEKGLYSIHQDPPGGVLTLRSTGSHKTYGMVILKDLPGSEPVEVALATAAENIAGWEGVLMFQLLPVEGRGGGEEDETMASMSFLGYMPKHDFQKSLQSGGQHLTVHIPRFEVLKDLPQL